VRLDTPRLRRRRYRFRNLEGYKKHQIGPIARRDGLISGKLGGLRLRRPYPSRGIVHLMRESEGVCVALQRHFVSLDIWRKGLKGDLPFSHE